MEADHSPSVAYLDSLVAFWVVDLDPALEVDNSVEEDLGVEAAAPDLGRCTHAEVDRAVVDRISAERHEAQGCNSDAEFSAAADSSQVRGPTCWDHDHPLEGHCP